MSGPMNMTNTLVKDGPQQEDDQSSKLLLVDGNLSTDPIHFFALISLEDPQQPVGLWPDAAAYIK